MKETPENACRIHLASEEVLWYLPASVESCTLNKAVLTLVFPRHVAIGKLFHLNLII